MPFSILPMMLLVVAEGTKPVRPDISHPNAYFLIAVPNPETAGSARPDRRRPAMAGEASGPSDEQAIAILVG
jgi:hypothetical protein